MAENVNYLMDLMDMDELNRLAPNQIRKPKEFKIRNDPFSLSNTEFKIKYRFSKQYARRIINLVENDLKQDSRGGGISCELQVLTALRTWARNEVQDDSGDIHGLSQQSVSNTCKRVGIALASKCKQFIKMPVTLAEQEEVMAQFRNLAGFRNVIGAVDCTHIKIKKVPGETSQFYINRKGFYSLNIQIVCDAQLRIRDIVAHWRGSSHDSRIFRESRIKQRSERGAFRGRLLGDSGYPCTPYLFTPLLNPRNVREENYNRAHIRTRNCIERCFGVWKARFRCLLQGFSCNLENTKIYIVALAELHNIAIEMGEEVAIQEIVNEEPEQLPALMPNNFGNGQAVRAAFINEYF